MPVPAAPEEQIVAVEAETEIASRSPSSTGTGSISNGGKVPAYTTMPGTAGPSLLSKIDRVERLPRIGRLSRMDIVPKDYLLISRGAPATA